MRGPSRTCHGTQLSWLAQPPNLHTPLLVAPESPFWTLRFLLQRVHHGLVGVGGAVGMGGRGGRGPLGQAPAPRGGQQVVGVAIGVARAG